MLKRIEIRGFRNLMSTSFDIEDWLDVELGDTGHLFLGDNGAGKTSFIEAVYLLATTRSFRTPKIVDCLRHGGDGFFIRGRTERRTILEVGWVDGRRVRRLNGGGSSLAEHLAVLPVVPWTPADLDILVGPPEARRRFIDRGIIGSKPSAIAVFSRYRQALQEKRKLLQTGSPRETLRDLLSPWNQILAQAAAQLTLLRQAQVEALQRELQAVSKICELGIPAVDLRYKPSPKESLDGVSAIFDKLDSVAEREIVMQQPLLGSHRDDIRIRWRGRAVKQVASAGERKALGLALTAAHGQVMSTQGIRPIYLLDDVDTELDAGRLASLWKFFGLAGQVLATSNRPAVWADLDVPFRFRCSAGTVSREG